MSAIAWTTIQKALQNWVVAGSGLANDHVLWGYRGAGRPSAPHIILTITSVRNPAHDFAEYEDNPLAFAPLPVLSVDTAADTLAIAAHPLVTADGPVRIASTGALPAPLQADTNYWVVVVDAGHVQLADSYEHAGGNNVARGLGSTPNPVTVLNLTSTGSGAITLSSTADTVRAGQELIQRAQGIREVVMHADCYAPEGSGIQAMQILTDVLAALQLHATELDNAGVGVTDFGEAFAQGGVKLVPGRRGTILEPRAMFDMTFYVASEITGFETIVSSVSADLELQSPGGDALPAIPVQVTRS